ncbi:MULTISPECIES: DUF6766 family protein [Acidobacterium]|uniref:Uncharacterized protein n=1 Tax=Acidobacterium capsulatum (strain ATCC 51196 / DSM 11244 / BCRC 80197 / JCM 7670 / NBRC 15755 / NCIMB 13165 / 161) TaxID=240015 RepID=C1FA61_ACIC5|nr:MULTISPECIES: DUF6766 family protein [Acidobacterium]ACO32579.1 conserved hypothetical protein [Acidobacterium capsulatum ATCC 51196]HCT62296.1 hypothetical protein [Acidobacterium sp.]
MRKLAKWIDDHSLLLAFVFLFLLCLICQIISGTDQYNQNQSMQGLHTVSRMQYLATGNFLDGMFSNWQAAVLQLGTLIVFAVFLKTRGAAHSLRPGGQRKSKTEGKKHRGKKQRSWLYRNSLSLAFALLFGAFFGLHLVTASSANNEQRALMHQPPIGLGAFAVSSTFWFETTQTWEAEFMAIGLYIFLSIYLRQEGSPESKPVDAGDNDTGETNK